MCSLTTVKDLSLQVTFLVFLGTFPLLVWLCLFFFPYLNYIPLAQHKIQFSLPIFHFPFYLIQVYDLKEQLEISASQYSCEKGEFKLQKKLGANTQIPTFQMLFPAETELGFSSNSRNSEHMYLPIHNSMMRDNLQFSLTADLKVYREGNKGTQPCCQQNNKSHHDSPIYETAELF